VFKECSCATALRSLCHRWATESRKCSMYCTVKGTAQRLPQFVSFASI